MTLHLHGLGHFHSETEITNKFLEDLDIGTNDQWILERVGIRVRRTMMPLDYIRETYNQDPRAALEAKGAGEIELAPPTFVTVTWLSQQADVRAAFRSLEGAPVLTFRPRLCKTPEGRCMLYPGDAGYEDEVFDRPGARHRLWLHAEGWSYERTI